jgi:hypothetical protein
LPPGRQIFEQHVTAMTGIAGPMLNDTSQSYAPQPTEIDDLPQDFVRIRLLIVDESGQRSLGNLAIASGRPAVKFERCNGCGHQPPVTDM